MSGLTTVRVLGFLAPIITVLVALAYNGFFGSIIDAFLQRATNIVVDNPKPQIFVLSEDPVVVYIKDFISAQEAAHLVHLAQVCPFNHDSSNQG